MGKSAVLQLLEGPVKDTVLRDTDREEVKSPGPSVIRTHDLGITRPELHHCATTTAPTESIPLK